MSRQTLTGGVRYRPPDMRWPEALLNIIAFAWWPESLRKRLGPKGCMHLKEPRVPYARSFQGWNGKLRLARLERRAARRKRFLLRQYQRLAQPVDLSLPFVYVALHFQPERTTSSLGGAFANQLLMVDLIARTIPEGWRVYVKEHPSQFYPGFAGERARHPHFYERLAQIPRVQLVALTVSPFALIDRARAVATVTGTSGWEAIARGTPVLLFGFGAWYRGVEGAFYVSTEDACRRAFARLERGYRIDEQQVRRFMAAVGRISVRADMGYGTPQEVESGLSRQDSATALASSLKRWAARSNAPCAKVC